MKSLRVSAAAVLLGLAVSACGDQTVPTAPLETPDQAVEARQAPAAPQALAALFGQVSPEVMALPGTVFAGRDDETGQMVVGVEDGAALFGVQRALARMGVDPAAYTLRIVEPIHFASETLRTRHRPTVGGIQIHWGLYVCTLGFNVDHSGGRSFITNSHCTDKQGETGTTAYYQPASSVDSSPIAIEADDPSYFKGGVCSRGKKCRYSDAARALYDAGTESTRGAIAKTTGVNSGSLDVAGSFTVTAQDNSNTSFSGTIHKVGRTTGWTSGSVTNTCVTVNVSGSNIQLLCQTLVRNSGTQIVAGGDSGSPVFQRGSADDVTLVGILWGGSSGGDLFVFSPLKSIQDELGGLTATSDGSGGGSGDGGGGGGGGDDDGNGNGDECIPRGPNGNNCK